MNRIPFIHQTDLFRPHEDPDDHFDLAAAYSLHLSGHCDLKGYREKMPTVLRDLMIRLSSALRT